jgi:hypothetical protein
MWSRFNLYEGTVIIFFIFNIVFYNLNEDYLHYIPNQVAGYMFWLSLGLWLGFELSKYEFKRVITKK